MLGLFEVAGEEGSCLESCILSVLRDVGSSSHRNPTVMFIEEVAPIKPRVQARGGESGCNLALTIFIQTWIVVPVPAVLNLSPSDPILLTLQHCCLSKL